MIDAIKSHGKSHGKSHKPEALWILKQNLPQMRRYGWI